MDARGCCRWVYDTDVIRPRDEAEHAVDPSVCSFAVFRRDEFLTELRQRFNGPQLIRNFGMFLERLRDLGFAVYPSCFIQVCGQVPMLLYSLHQCVS